jgi:hypothetical protein
MHHVGQAAERGVRQGPHVRSGLTRPVDECGDLGAAERRRLDEHRLERDPGVEGLSDEARPVDDERPLGPTN